MCSREPWGAIFGCSGALSGGCEPAEPTWEAIPGWVSWNEGDGSLSAAFPQQEKWPERPLRVWRDFQIHLQRCFVPNSCGFQLKIRSTRGTVPLLTDGQSEAGGVGCSRRPLRHPWAEPGVGSAPSMCPARGWIG